MTGLFFGWAMVFAGAQADDPPVPRPPIDWAKTPIGMSEEAVRSKAPAKNGERVEAVNRTQGIPLNWKELLGGAVLSSMQVVTVIVGSVYFKCALDLLFSSSNQVRILATPLALAVTTAVIIGDIANNVPLSEYALPWGSLVAAGILVDLAALPFLAGRGPVGLGVLGVFAAKLYGTPILALVLKTGAQYVLDHRHATQSRTGSVKGGLVGQMYKIAGTLESSSSAIR